MQSMAGLQMARGALRLLNSADNGPREIVTQLQPGVLFEPHEKAGHVVMDVDGARSGTYELTPEIIAEIVKVHDRSLTEGMFKRATRAGKEQTEDEVADNERRRKEKRNYHPNVAVLPHTERGFVILRVRSLDVKTEFEMYTEIIDDMRFAQGQSGKGE